MPKRRGNLPRHKRKPDTPKQIPEPVHNPIPKPSSRRKFLTAAVLVGGDALLETHGCGIISFLMKQMGREQGWRFLDRSYKLEEKSVSWRFVDENCVPWAQRGVARSGKTIAELKKNLLPKISAHMRSQGKNPTDYNLLPIRQDYGLPCKDQESAQDLLAFCKNALDYLYTRLPQIVQIPFKHVIMEPGKDYSKTHQTIFIGDTGYTMYRIYSHKKEMKIENIEPLENLLPFAITASPSVGCKAFLKHTPGDRTQIEQYNVFVSNSPYALLGIPSEVIPRTTMPVSMELTSRLGRDMATMADETIVEGISTLLVREMIDEFQIPNGHQLMEAVRKYMFANASVYRYVPQSTRWLEKNGIENGLELYMEDPIKFILAIKKA